MAPAIRLPSPPPITARPPPARTYVKSMSVAHPKTAGVETHKLRLPSNFLGTQIEYLYIYIFSNRLLCILLSV